MTEKYLLFSLEDESSKKLGEVISSNTARKIVNLLAEKNLSESEIANELGIPLNTVDYNIKKLVGAGIVEKAKHWWSVKGRKIEIYQLANKLIVISQKKTSVYFKLKGIIPAALISGIVAFVVALLSRTQEIQVERAGDYGMLAEKAAGTAVSAGVSVFPVWLWFLLGSLAGIIIFLIWNWKKL